MEDLPKSAKLKGVLRKAMSGHLGMHRITTIQKVFKPVEMKRGARTKDKYTNIATKFKMLEHSVTLEDNHGDDNNENTRVERTIVQTAIRSIVVLSTFFAVGGLALYFIDGQLNLFEILYFLVITLTTIGYGDISPSNDYSKLFVSLYTLCGLMLLSTALSGMVRYWSNQTEKRYRRQVLDRIEQEDYMNDPYEYDSDGEEEEGEEGKVHVDTSETNAQAESGEGLSKVPSAPNASSTMAAAAAAASAAGVMHIYDFRDSVSRYLVEKLRIPPFAVPILIDLLKSVLHIVLNISFGTLCFYWLQDEESSNFIDALYLTVTTITTVGYGDVVPSTMGAKYFTIIYACVGTLFTAKCVLKFNQAITNYQKEERMDIILRSEFSLKAFFDMDSDGNNEVTKEEFLLYKILHMNLVDPDIIARIERQFNAWDVDGSGALTTADIDMNNKARQGRRVKPNLLSMSRRRGGSGSTNDLEGYIPGAGRGSRVGKSNSFSSFDHTYETSPRTSLTPSKRGDSFEDLSLQGASSSKSVLYNASPAKIHPLLGTCDIIADNNDNSSSNNNSHNSNDHNSNHNGSSNMSNGAAWCGGDEGNGSNSTARDRDLADKDVRDEELDRQESIVKVFDEGG